MIKLHYITFMLLLSSFGVVYSQFAVSHHTTAGQPDMVRRDQYGNTYMAMNVNGDSLGGIAYPNPSSPGYGIAKFDAQGNFVWSSMCDYVSSYFWMHDMDIDANGNVLFTGEYSDTIIWGGFQDVNLTIAGAYWETVIGLIDSTGTLQWMYGFDNTNTSGKAAQFLPNGNIAYGASVQGPATFNGYAFQPSSSLEGYVMLLDRQGSVLSSHHLNAVGNVTIPVLRADPNGDIWIVSSFLGSSATFLGSTIQSNALPGNYSSFFAKLDQAGNLDWVAAFDSNTAYVTDLVFDAGGNCYFAADLTGDITFGSLSIANSNIGGQDFLAGKIDPNGNPVWMVPSISPSNESFFEHIDYHPSGRVLLTGYASYGTGTFAGMPFSSPFTYRSYLAVLDTNGVGLFSMTLDSLLNAYGNGEFIDSSTILLGGYYPSNSNANLLGNPLPDYLSSMGAWWAEISLASNMLQGFHYADLDQNGSFGGADVLVPYAPLTTGNGLAGITDTDGAFKFFVGPGPYSVATQPASGVYTVLPGNYTGNFVGLGNADTNLVFRSIPSVMIGDLRLDLVAPLTGRVGFDHNVYLLASNLGSVAAAGTVTLELDPQTSLSSATPLPDTISGNHLAWNTPSISPLGQYLISAQVHVDTTAQLGDSLMYRAHLASNGADFDQLNQSDTSIVTATASFDPNDKSVSPTHAPETYVNSSGKLVYQIRFQNTGNDTAFRVIVRDTLSPLLDASSFRMLGSSHPCILSLHNGNELTWIFNPITLPDSGANLPGSQGFILFELGTAPGLHHGDSIQNRAGIFFDYNAPVLTNEAMFQVQNLSTSLAPVASASKVRLYPNPGSGGFGLFGLDDAQLPIEIQVLDRAGRTMVARRISDQEQCVLIPTENLLPGLHLVQVVTQQGDRLIFKWMHR